MYALYSYETLQVVTSDIHQLDNDFTVSYSPQLLKHDACTLLRIELFAKVVTRNLLQLPAVRDLLLDR